MFDMWYGSKSASFACFAELQLESDDQSKPKLDVERICKLAESMSLALLHLNVHDIVHRDIVPRNFIVREDDNNKVVIINFGLARRVRFCFRNNI